MSTQHTPGPWIWGPNARLYADASLPECQRVMNVQIGKTTALCWDIKDAQLIAAAPDLLGALQDLLNATEETYDNRHERQVALDAIIRATRGAV